MAKRKIRGLLVLPVIPFFLLWVWLDLIWHREPTRED